MRAAHQAHSLREFLQMVPVEEVERILRRFRPLGTEVVEVEEAAGRIVARTIKSPIDMPHFARAGMDGLAVRAKDTLGASAAQPVELRLVGSVEMGKKPRFRLQAGTAARISTGGMMPPGADAMVMREYCDERRGDRVLVRKQVRAGENVIEVGEDVRKGEIIFNPGRRLRAQDLGALTGVGLTRVAVYKKPKVAVIATGDEIVPPWVKPRPGQVRDINHYSLKAMTEACGGIPVDFGVVRDDLGAIGRALKRALARADLVAISGGSSVGTKDLTLRVIRGIPRARVLVHGIGIKPGKPTILATAGSKPIIGLPGHPVSALVIFGLFAVPLLRILGGEEPESALRSRNVVRATVTGDLRAAPDRDTYARVALEPRGGGWAAVPLKGGSSAIFSLARADGMVRVPKGSKGIAAGCEVEVAIFS